MGGGGALLETGALEVLGRSKRPLEAAVEGGEPADEKKEAPENVEMLLGGRGRLEALGARLKAALEGKTGGLRVEPKATEKVGVLRGEKESLAARVDALTAKVKPQEETKGALRVEPKATEKGKGAAGGKRDVSSEYSCR